MKLANKFTIYITSIIALIAAGLYYLYYSQGPVLHTERVFWDLMTMSLSMIVLILAVTHLFIRLLSKSLDNTTVSRDYMNGIIESLANILIVVDSNCMIKTINPLAARKLGYHEEELIGKHLSLILVRRSESDRRLIKSPIIERLSMGDNIANMECLLYQKGGTSTAVLFSGTILHDQEPDKRDIVCVAQDITELKEAQNRLSYMAGHDALTNLPNRALFLEHLESEIARANRHHLIFAILFIDVDNFKTINDTLGHHIGDLLLKKVAERLRSLTRTEDTITRLDTDELAVNSKVNEFVARLGGDEFVVGLSDLKQQIDAGIVAKRLVSLFQEPFKIEKKEIHITISVGIAVCPSAGKDAITLIKNADIAMYRAKELGRNMYHYFSEELNVSYQKHVEIENGLRTAIGDNQLFLVYQPQYNIKTEEIIGVEALLRWKHPQLGLVSPIDFMPVAEKSGLIIPIGKWVLQTACEQFSKWQAINNNLGRDIKLSVNLSPLQLIRGEFVASLKEILDRTKISSDNLELELTETVLMSNLGNAEEVLWQLQDMGISIAIDDFGTGYSSLSRLKDLPVSTLKIDQSFIKDVDSNPNNAAIVKSILALAKQLGLVVISEGVETEQEVQFLRKNEGIFVQGYYFSKPLPVEEVEKLLNPVVVQS